MTNLTAEAAPSLGPITSWLSEESLRSVYSSKFWNDIEAGQDKAWWIASGTEAAFRQLRIYLDESGLMEQYNIAAQSILQVPGKQLAIADLAAGIGWTSSLLSRLPNVGSIHAVEISKHRLEVLFPQAVRMFSGDIAKVNRYVGSFYDLGFDDASMDVVFLSQAFHHADNPLRLLTEIDRILKLGGKLVLIGENFIGVNSILKRMIKVLLLERRLCWNFYALFPPDDDSGDHYYRSSDYYLFCQLLGFRVEAFSVHRKRSAVIVAEKSPNVRRWSGIR